MGGERHSFASFFFRDHVYRIIKELWRIHQRKRRPGPSKSAHSRSRSQSAAGPASPDADAPPFSPPGEKIAASPGADDLGPRSPSAFGSPMGGSFQDGAEDNGYEDDTEDEGDGDVLDGAAATSAAQATTSQWGLSGAISAKALPNLAAAAEHIRTDAASPELAAIHDHMLAPLEFAMLEGYQLAISPLAFFDLFVADSSAFLRQLREATGAKELETDEWRPFGGGGRVRECRFVQPIRSMVSPIRQTRVLETQRTCWLIAGHAAPANDVEVQPAAAGGPASDASSPKQAPKPAPKVETAALVLQFSQVFADTPYGDYFTVEHKWVVHPEQREGVDSTGNATGSRVHTSVEVVFTKPTWLQSKILSGCVSECTEYYQVFSQLAERAIADERPRKGLGPRRPSVARRGGSQRQLLTADKAVVYEAQYLRLMTGTAADAGEGAAGGPHPGAWEPCGPDVADPVGKQRPGWCDREGQAVPSLSTSVVADGIAQLSRSEAGVVLRDTRGRPWHLVDAPRHMAAVAVEELGWFYATSWTGPWSRRPCADARVRCRRWQEQGGAELTTRLGTVRSAVRGDLPGRKLTPPCPFPRATSRYHATGMGFCPRCGRGAPPHPRARPFTSQRLRVDGPGGTPTAVELRRCLGALCGSRGTAALPRVQNASHGAAVPPVVCQRPFCEAPPRRSRPALGRGPGTHSQATQQPPPAHGSCTDGLGIASPRLAMDDWLAPLSA